MGQKKVLKFECDGCPATAELEAHDSRHLPEMMQNNLVEPYPEGWKRQIAEGIVSPGDYCPQCIDAVQSAFKKRRHAHTSGQFRSTESV